MRRETTRRDPLVSTQRAGGRGVVRRNAPVDSVPYLESVIPHNRLDHLAAVCRDSLLRNPGNILEIGVYRGGSLRRLSRVLMDVCPQYKVIGIDTFTGHPYTDGHPVHPIGKYADVDLATLRQSLDQDGCGAFIELHRGQIESVLETLVIRDIAFAHIDCDLYQPVKYCAEHLPALMRSGGVMYFDDYGHEHCPGATKAVTECFPERVLHEVFIPEDGTCWSCYLKMDELT